MDASRPTRIWAPTLEGVDLVVEGEAPRPLVADGTGWFDGPQLAAGTRYRLRVHGGPGDGRTITDPGAHAAPDGVFGPAQAVDHEAFAWTDDGWDGGRGADRARAVVYELHVGTFTPEGTFDAAAQRLQHLVDLGATHVELLPVNTFMGSKGWGYDGVLWWAPHHAYGGPDGLKRFVDACHRHGLAVLIDAVYNHLGPEGDTTWALWPIKNPEHQTPWGDAINLDGEHGRGVKDLILDSALGWLRRYHADGLRLDAVHALVDDSPVHLLCELSQRVDDLSAELGRPLWLTAESEHRSADQVTPRALGGLGLHAVWADDLHHTLHTVLTGEDKAYYAPYGTPQQVATCLVDPYRGRAPGTAGDAPGVHFVVCDQNHDQVGNRARGERLSHLAGVDGALAALTLVLCSTQVPLLWMGEEWAATTPWPFFADPADADLAKAISEGRRGEFAEFGWAPEDVPDPVDPATAASAVLRWEELAEGDHARALEHVRRVLQLRATHPDLGAGDRAPQGATAGDGGTVVLRRGSITVVAHLRPTHAVVEAPAGAEVLASVGPCSVADGTVTFGGAGAAILTS